ncbi:hypothetical protein [Thermoactinomyces mirandus]|uniref:Uncharacterized protein n=1 Tax=Thermoactinomyces mirandus TaxID=2756294 RepID=A0A7W1XS17_9BACL|nr:hypothetical protein [Thermoactinomyces mirandus]MBA4602234.1 hypothetical protein [Thermoactinomyces mirandus]
MQKAGPVLPACFRLSEELIFRTSFCDIDIATLLKIASSNSPTSHCQRKQEMARSLSKETVWAGVEGVGD